MRFVKIDLNDFKVYYGHQVIDLSTTDSRRNLVPIGGLNGAGKTTLLDGITFGLLGEKEALTHVKALGLRGDDLALRDRERDSILNRTALSEGRLMAAVSLDLAEADQIITVRREWHFDDAGHFQEETLHVLVDGEPLPSAPGEAPQEVYDDFLKNTIPPHVARFFMFDGEEIQRIAQQDPDLKVRQGIDTLLGFQLLDKLKQDLDDRHEHYRKKNEKRNRQAVDLDVLKDAEANLEKRVNELDQDLLEAETRAEQVREQLSGLNAELEQLLGPGGKRPTELQADYDRAKDGAAKGRQEIEGMIDDVIALSLPTSVIESLAQQLNGEQLYQQWDEGRRTVQPQLERLVVEVFGPAAPQPVPPLQPPQNSFLVELLRERWKHLFYPPPQGMATERRHDTLTNEELDQVRAKCSEVTRRQSSDLRSVLDNVEALERRASELESHLKKVGSRDEINKLISKRDQLNRQIGQVQEECSDKARQLKTLRSELKQKRQDIDKKEAELDESGQFGERAKLAKKVKHAVQRYQDELRPRKRTELREHLRTMYRNLARKEDVVQDIDLEEGTYRVRLLDRKEKELPIHELSAGEKEIFALALLWALAKTSRRDLPVVIDTPLARLDSHHRTNIVTRYLPVAGTQILVLSTDTELDQQYFRKIREHVAKTFHLRFDAATERTTIEEGYFGFA
jgi:DNA sulfur modification protein DndD